MRIGTKNEASVFLLDGRKIFGYTIIYAFFRYKTYPIESFGPFTWEQDILNLLKSRRR
jgi:hypothetical protein